MKAIKIFSLGIMLLWIAGCSNGTELPYDNEKSAPIDNINKSDYNSVPDESTEIAYLYKNLFLSMEEKPSDKADVKKEIITFLGKKGFVVTDTNNEVNLENPEKVRSFCDKASNEETDILMILRIMDNGGFIRFDFTTEAGKIKIIVSTMKWQENGVPEVSAVDEFIAHSWEYTDKGYFLFKKELPAGYHGPSGNYAIRVQPLDELLHEYSSIYLRPIGYDDNNIFLADWSENDYNNLSLADMFPIFYKMKNDVPFSYSDSIGNSYELPKDEFEDIMKSYLSIDEDIIRQQIKFKENSSKYIWRSRRVDEYQSFNWPYPEAVGYAVQSDGTLKLTVDAVWPDENTDHAFTHEVVLRLFDDGSFQYVSNYLIPSKHNITPPYINRYNESDLE